MGGPRLHEKAMITKDKEAAKKAKVEALEGGTPSNTPPPLTPAHDLQGQKPTKVPVSPLAANDKKPAPLATSEEVGVNDKKPAPLAISEEEPELLATSEEEQELLPTTSKEEPTSKVPAVVVTEIEEPVTSPVDKNGKVMQTPDINGNTEIPPTTSSSRSSAKSDSNGPFERKTKSKMCGLL